VTNSREFYEPLDEVEALIRSAGSYVQPSDDLRPRIVEAARMQCGERRVRRWLQQAAVLVALLGIITAGAYQRWDHAADRQPGVAFEAASTLSQAAVVAGGGDPNWEMVESFTQLRRRQAELLRFDL